MGKHMVSARRIPKVGQFYASIFEYFLFDKNLKPGAKVLLAALHAKSFRNKNLISGKCQATVSQQTLADQLGVQRRSIQYWLNELAEVNAIHITCRKRKYEPNIYTLLLPPEQKEVGCNPRQMEVDGPRPIVGIVNNPEGTKME